MNAHEEAYVRAAQEIEDSLPHVPEQRRLVGAIVWSNGTVSIVPRRSVSEDAGDGVPVRVFALSGYKTMWHRRSP